MTPPSQAKTHMGQRCVRPSTVTLVMLVLLCGALVVFESSLMPESVRRLRPNSNSNNANNNNIADELMTPALIQEIKAHQETNLTSPMHVHLVWIGNITKAPPSMRNYTDLGYKLTVHTSVEKILEGFHPYVLRAFQLAVPAVVGFDFLKLALLYKYGGLAADADTSPAIPASELQWPTDCDVIFGKENWLPKEAFSKPQYHNDITKKGYPFNRPFQVLNWAMVASKPQNPHIKRLLEMAMMHFLGLRDMEFNIIQDVAGSGLMTDYVALLHEREGRNYEDVYRDTSKHVPVQGMCLTQGYLNGMWIRHEFIGTWKD